MKTDAGYIYAVRSDDGVEGGKHSVKCGFTCNTDIDVWIRKNYGRCYVPLITVRTLFVPNARSSEGVMHMLLDSARKHPRHEVFLCA